MPDRSYFRDVCELYATDQIPNGEIGVRPAGKLLQNYIESIGEEWTVNTVPALNKYYDNTSLENFTKVAQQMAAMVFFMCDLSRVLGVPLDEIWKTAISIQENPEASPDLGANLWDICYKHWQERRLAEQKQTISR